MPRGMSASAELSSSVPGLSPSSRCSSSRLHLQKGCCRLLPLFEVQQGCCCSCCSSCSPYPTTQGKDASLHPACSSYTDSVSPFSFQRSSPILRCVSELPGLCITVLQSQFVQLEGLIKNLWSAVSKVCVWKVEEQDSTTSARNHPCGLCLLFMKDINWPWGDSCCSGELSVSQWHCIQEVYRKNGICTLSQCDAWEGHFKVHREFGFQFIIK